MTQKVAILSDYQNVSQSLADWSDVAAQADIHVFDPPAGGIEAIAESLQDFTILCVMRERIAFPAALLDRLPKLRCIVTTGGVNRAIDLDAARARGIVVSGTPNGDASRATAELAWGLLLAAARGIVREDRAVRAGGWQVGLGTSVFGKTLGLVGLGNIGEMVARYATAFGMNIIAWSQNLTEDRAAQCGAVRVDKDALFRKSDAISIHMVLSERTKGLVGARELAAMKPGAVLVNTSRGPIIDQEALVVTIASGVIGPVALDTYEVEPLPADHPLRKWPDRVILSPHVGYVTRDVYRIFYEGTVESVLAFLSGEPIRRLA